jgi:phenylalanyl-tRNA synthetase alpha chain
MKEQLLRIREDAEAEIRNASNISELDAVRVKYLGKKGNLTMILRGMGALPEQERPMGVSLVMK